VPVDADLELIEGVRQGQRRALAKAITLLESTRDDHRARAAHVLDALLPFAGRSLRLGISGAPGAGKSTFIEALGLALVAHGHRVAVLAVDPSSAVTGGSILGDKTRMERLSLSDAAYIRPSPSLGTLGGVAERTRETILLCEAASFDWVIVETVGVGQSETAVAGMTDLFLLLQLPNAGDDLQAAKRGTMELADIVAVNKSDLDSAGAARTLVQISNVLRAQRASGNPRRAAGEHDVHVTQISAMTGDGIEALRTQIETLAAERRANGKLDQRRRTQAVDWMWELIERALQSDFRNHPAVRAALQPLLEAVGDARTSPATAARTLLDLSRN
jgi:LAO/AO transport system kinase